jgi:hypothetical protein
MVSLGFNAGIGLAATTSAWFAGSAFTIADVNDGLSKSPAYIADFRRDRHALTSIPLAGIASATVDGLIVPQSVAFTDLFSFTRSSVAEYVDVVGAAQQAAVDTPRFDYRNGLRQLLLEGAATNLFLNAFAPATQTVTVVSGSQYTVSCRGSGSLVLSGAVTGTATQASSPTFTASSTSLTLTVSGALSRAQVETGAVASSFVQTGGTAAARSADSCRFSAIGEALVQRSAATLVVKGQGLSGSLGRLVGAGSGDDLIRLNTAQTNILSGNSLVLAAVTSPLPACGVSLAWSGTGRSGSYNGATVNSDAIMPTTTGQVYLGRNQSGLFAAGRYDSLAIWPFPAAPASRHARAVAYA